MIGTPMYMAPELFTLSFASPKGCLPSRDVWSLGVILYTMLGGKQPFYPGKNEKSVFDQVRTNDYTFPPTMFSGVSKEAIDLIKKMMEPHPNLRITLEGIENHPWIKPPQAVLAPLKLSLPPVGAMQPISTSFLGQVLGDTSTPTQVSKLVLPKSPQPVLPKLVLQSPIATVPQRPQLVLPKLNLTLPPKELVLKETVRYIYTVDALGKKRYFLEKRIPISANEIPFGVVPTKVAHYL